MYLVSDGSGYLAGPLMPVKPLRGNLYGVQYDIINRSISLDFTPAQAGQLDNDYLTRHIKLDSLGFSNFSLYCCLSWAAMTRA